MAQVARGDARERRRPVLEEWCFLQAAIHDELGEEAPDWLDQIVDEAQQADNEFATASTSDGEKMGD